MKPFKLLTPAFHWRRICVGASAALLALLFTSCGDGNSTSNDSASLTISVPQPQAAKEHAAKINALPGTVKRIDVSVTTAMQVLASSDILAMGGEMTVGVPAGVALTVSSVAYDVNNVAIYQGSATVAALAAGARSTVSVTLNSLTPTYLAYTTTEGVVNGLAAVDPANPTAPITIETSGLIGGKAVPPVNTVYTANYNAAMQTLSDYHAHARIYPKTDGRLYKVTAVKGTSQTRVQVSNESLAAGICAVEFVATDYADVNNSQYGYRLPGLNGSCDNSDDEYKMVRLGMTANATAADTPIAAKPNIATLTNSTTGAIIGHLVPVLDTSGQTPATNLSRCNADFANCTTVRPFPLGTVIKDRNVNLGFDRHLLEINNELYLYTVSTNTLSAASLFSTASNPITGITSDANTIYFTADKAIYTITLPTGGGAPVPATVLLDEKSAITPLSGLRLTTDKLVYTLNDGTNTLIRAVAKSGGTASTLITSPGILTFHSTSGTHLYYQEISGGIFSAGIVEDNGSNIQTFAKAAWVGWTFPTSFSVAPGAPILFENLILAQGYDASNNIGGGTLSAYHSASRSLTALLGTVPTDITASMLCFGFSVSAVLCYAPSVGTGVRQDIFFVHSQMANSLSRVTTSPTINERPFF